MTRARRWVGGLARGLAVLAGLLGAIACLLASDTFVRWALRRAASVAGYDLAVADLSHDLGRRLVLRRATLGAHGLAPAVRVESIDIGYDLSTLFAGEGIALSIGIEKPRVDLALREDGSLEWPSPAGPPEDEAAAVDEERRADPTLLPSLPIRIERLALTEGRFGLGERYELEGIRIDAAGPFDPPRLGAAIAIERAAYRGEPLGRLDARVVIDEKGLSVSSFQLATAPGRISGHGRWDPRTGLLAAELVLDSLDLARVLAPLHLDREIPSPISGGIDLSGRAPGSIRLRADLRAPHRGSEIETTVSADGSLGHIDSLEVRARWAGADLRAKGSLDLESDRTRLEIQGRSESVEFLERGLGVRGLAGRGLRLDAVLSGALGAPAVRVIELGLESASYRSARIEAPTFAGSFDARTGAVEARARFRDLGANGASLGEGWIEASGDVRRIDLDLGIARAIGAKGAVELETGRVEIEARIDDLALDPFLEIGGLHGMRGSIGRLRGKVEGVPSEVATLAGSASLEGLVIDAGGSHLSQAGPLAVELEEGLIRARGGFEVGRGRIETTGEVVLPSRRIEARASGEADMADLKGLVLQFVPGLGDLEGQIRLAASIRGGLSEPDLDIDLAGRRIRVEIGPGGDASEGAEGPPRLVAEVGELDAKVAGPFASLSGTLGLQAGQASALGREASGIAARARLDRGTLRVDEIALTADGVSFAGRGVLGRGGEIEAELRTTEGARLERISEAARASIEGGFALSLKAGGTLAEPVVSAALSVPEIGFRGEPLGALDLGVDWDGSRVEVDGTLPGGGRAKGTLGLAGAMPFRVLVEADDLSLDPVARVLEGALPAALKGLGGRVSMRADLEGAAREIESVRGEVVLDRLDLAVAGLACRLAEPSRIRLDSGAAELDRARLTVDGSYLEVGGSFDLDSQRIRLKAEVDAAVARPFLVDAQIGNGGLSVEADVERTDGVISATGDMRASLDSLRVRGYPEPLARIELGARMNGAAIEVDTLRARIGDGEATAKAKVRLDRGGEIEGTLSFVELPYRIPDTLRILLGGELHMRGGPDGFLVAGRVRVDEALYERDVEVLEGLLRPVVGQSLGASGAAVRSSPPVLEKIRLDLKIESGEDLRVRNNIARIRMLADLSLTGTAASPGLVGQVRVSEGTLDLFGREFQIETGSVDFRNPFRIEPVVAIRTRTVVERPLGDVDVRLGLSGSLSEGIALGLTSDPTFTQEDIAFLLVTGKTRDEVLSGGGKATGLTGVSVAALGLVGGKTIRETLGLTELDMEETETGGVQVTVGKQLSERLRVRAVNDLAGSTPAVALAAEYRVTDNLILVAEPQSTGALGAEVRLRFRFR